MWQLCGLHDLGRMKHLIANHSLETDGLYLTQEGFCPERGFRETLFVFQNIKKMDSNLNKLARTLCVCQGSPSLQN